MRYLYYFFHTKSSKYVVFLHLHTSQFGLTTFQGLNKHMGLWAAIVDSTVVEYKHAHRVCFVLILPFLSFLVPSLFLLLFPSLFCSFSLLLCLCMPHDKDTTVSNIGLSPKS